MFAILAGFLAARLAPRAPVAHAAAVAALLALAAVVPLLMQFGEASLWSHVATLLGFAPSAVLGGYLRHWQTQRQSLTTARGLTSQ